MAVDVVCSVLYLVMGSPCCREPPLPCSVMFGLRIGSVSGLASHSMLLPLARVEVRHVIQSRTGRKKKFFSGRISLFVTGRRKYLFLEMKQS